MQEFFCMGDTHLTSTLRQGGRGGHGVRQKCDVIGRRRVEDSKCSGRPTFKFFLLKKIGFAP